MTLAEVLASFGVDEEQFAEGLARELQDVPHPDASGLSEQQEEVLREYSGIVVAVGGGTSVRRGVAQAAASNLAVLTRESLSVDQAARLLAVDPSRVRHRVRDRALFGFRLGASLRLPVWQFDDREVIPGLRPVLAALPERMHPLEIAGFMTTPDADLAVADVPTSPRDWLIGGGDPGAVVAQARDLDAW